MVSYAHLLCSILPSHTVEKVTDWSQIGPEKGKKAKKERKGKGNEKKAGAKKLVKF